VDATKTKVVHKVECFVFTRSSTYIVSSTRVFCVSVYYTNYSQWFCCCGLLPVTHATSERIHWGFQLSLSSITLKSASACQAQDEVCPFIFLYGTMSSTNYDQKAGQFPKMHLTYQDQYVLSNID